MDNHLPDATTEPQSNENSYMTKLAGVPIEFSCEDIKEMTNNFPAEGKLGSGASGSVFRGTLKDGSKVAVKRVEESQYAKIMFKAEVSALATSRHKHLVRFRGYGRQIGGAFYVVYDLLPKGSLDTWIFPKSGGPADRYLSWEQRYQVAIGVAKALVYLHQCCEPRILHLDVKPENILLDENFQAVLSDFGLSRLTREKENEILTNTVRGTLGYMAPESNLRNLISEKFDIYSFGKVLLDLYFGKRSVCLDQNGNDIYERGGNSQREHRLFHSFMRTIVTDGNVVDLVDERLKVKGKVDALEAKTLLDVALRCIEEDSEKRPSDMQKVLHMLEEKNPPSDECLHADVTEYNPNTGEFLRKGIVVVIVHKASHIPVQYSKSPIHVKVTLYCNGKNVERKSTGEMMNGGNLEWKQKQEFRYSIEKGSRSGLSKIYVEVLSQLETVGDAEIPLATLLEKKYIKQEYLLQTNAPAKDKHYFRIWKNKKAVPEDLKVHIEMKWLRQ